MLSILIPTVKEREHMLNSLIAKVKSQIPKRGLVEIVIYPDNREISIGAKRQQLLEACTTEWFVMIDDDDTISDYYISEALKALKSNPDCVTYYEAIITNGRKEIADHSNKYSDWGGGRLIFSCVRTPYYKDIIRTSIAKQIRFKDMRYGEDHDFSKRLKQSGLIKSEVHIDKEMYIYNMPSGLKPEEHKKRYGIK